MRVASYFQHVVLLTLALPAGACGGSTATPGGPGPADSGPDATKLPTTSCAWSAGSRSSCVWSLEFTGEAVPCAGFSGAGTPSECLSLCGLSDMATAPISCEEIDGSDGGQSIVNCYACTLNGGRRPAYFAALGFDGPAPGREVGSHFARAACMEAASVDAFRGLRDELVAHGAPRRLVRAASRAVRDELRHVRVTSALARRFGEEPIAPRPAPARAVRPLLDVALENAVEGCVRETYAALECLWQAHVATDAVVRAEMRRIARDELRHLALSWDVHAWITGRLDRVDRARVRRAQEEAIAILHGEVDVDPHAALVRTAGLPSSEQSKALIARIATRIAA